MRDIDIAKGGDPGANILNAPKKDLIDFSDLGDPADMSDIGYEVKSVQPTIPTPMVPGGEGLVWGILNPSENPVTGLSGVVPTTPAGMTIAMLRGIGEGKKAIDVWGARLKRTYPESRYASFVAHSSKFLSEMAPSSFPQAIAQGLGEVLVPGAVTTAKPIIQKALSEWASKIGGVSEHTAAILNKNAPLVIKYARMGFEKTSEMAALAAKKFQSAIDNHMEDASNKYVDLAIKSVKQKYGPGIRLNLKKGVGSRIAEIADEYGYGDPSPLNFTDEASQRTYGKVMDAVDTLGNATIDDVYKFQKRLNVAIRNSSGPLKSALGKIKTAAVDYLEKHVPEIQQGNEVYKAGITLVEDLSKVSNADDAVRVINTAMRNRGITRDAIIRLIERSPAAKQALEEMVASHAGKEISRMGRYIPSNGLATGVGLALWGLAKMARAGPVGAIVTGLAGAAATSPRIIGEAANVIAKIPEVTLPAGMATAALATGRTMRERTVPEK